MLRLPLCCLTGSLSAGSNLLHVTAKLTNFSKYVSTFHFIFYISYVVHRYFAISRISGSIKIMARIFGEIFFLSFISFFAKQITSACSMMDRWKIRSGYAWSSTEEVIFGKRYRCWPIENTGKHVSRVIFAENCLMRKSGDEIITIR